MKEIHGKDYSLFLRTKLLKIHSGIASSFSLSNLRIHSIENILRDVDWNGTVIGYLNSGDFYF